MLLIKNVCDFSYISILKDTLIVHFIYSFQFYNCSMRKTTMTFINTNNT